MIVPVQRYLSGLPEEFAQEDDQEDFILADEF